jgi:hypothetical protein
MKRLIPFCIALLLLAPLTAFASLDDFLNSVNVQARVDLPGFSARVSTQFGVPVAQVNAVLQSVPQPADAFMVFQLGQFARVPSDRVMEVYKPNKKKGWGAIAKELGIKPGSAEFHALKSGDLHFTGTPAGSDDSPGKGKGKGKGKGHNK